MKNISSLLKVIWSRTEVSSSATLQRCSSTEKINTVQYRQKQIAVRIVPLINWLPGSLEGAFLDTVSKHNIAVNIVHFMKWRTRYHPVQPADLLTGLGSFLWTILFSILLSLKSNVPIILVRVQSGLMITHTHTHTCLHTFSTCSTVSDL